MDLQDFVLITWGIFFPLFFENLIVFVKLPEDELHYFFFLKNSSSVLGEGRGVASSEGV